MPSQSCSRFDPPTGEENGTEYDAYCEECRDGKVAHLRNRGIEKRNGAWWCPIHRDGCHVIFEPRVTVSLRLVDARTLHELVVARAVQVESAEEQALSGLGSERFRRPADTVRSAIDV